MKPWVFLFLLLLAACNRIPPFNEEISQGYLDFSGLTPVASIDKLRISANADTDTMYRYFPMAEAPRSGFFFVLNKNHDSECYFIREDGSTEYINRLSYRIGGDGRYFPLVAHMIGGKMFFFLESNSGSPNYSFYSIASLGMLSTGDGGSIISKVNGDIIAQNGPTLSLELAGAYIQPATNKLYLLCRKSSSNQFFEFNYTLSQLGALVQFSPTRSAFTNYVEINASYEDITYFFDEQSGKASLFTKSGGVNTLFSWDNNRVLAVDSEIDALPTYFTSSRHYIAMVQQDSFYLGYTRLNDVFVADLEKKVLKTWNSTSFDLSYEFFSDSTSGLYTTTTFFTEKDNDGDKKYSINLYFLSAADLSNGG